MKGKEHMNFQAYDENLGPALISIKDVSSEDGLKMTHMILRLPIGTFQQYLQVEDAEEPNKIAESARRLCPGLSIELCSPVISRQASEILATFDQESELKQFKFGVIFQSKGQVTEKQILDNSDSNKSFERFLTFLGKKVRISDHSKYKGGLESIKDSEDIFAIHQSYMDCDIIFHIAPFLPLKERKSFITNDIVAIVFQEEATHFHPDIIQSQFLHAYIVIQPTEDNEYKISVVTKADVPEFGPDFQNEGSYPRGHSFKQLLLAKLINAENACYKAHKFKDLEERRRSSLLNELSDTLSEDTSKYLKPTPQARRGKSMDETSLSYRDRTNLNIMRIKSAKKKRSQSLMPLQTTILSQIGSHTENKFDEYGRRQSIYDKIKPRIQPRRIRMQEFSGFPENRSASGSLDSIDEIASNFKDLSMDSFEDVDATEKHVHKDNLEVEHPVQRYKKNEKKSLFRILKTNKFANLN